MLSVFELCVGVCGDDGVGDCGGGLVVVVCDGCGIVCVDHDINNNCVCGGTYCVQYCC